MRIPKRLELLSSFHAEPALPGTRGSIVRRSLGAGQLAVVAQSMRHLPKVKGERKEPQRHEKGVSPNSTTSMRNADCNTHLDKVRVVEPRVEPVLSIHVRLILHHLHATTTQRAEMSM